MLIIKPDLMQRTITMHIEKPKVVREEDDVWNAFQAARAEILGGILDILVKAIGTYPTLELENLPRMADFYRWGYAIADAMDKKANSSSKIIRLILCASTKVLCITTRSAVLYLS